MNEQELIIKQQLEIETLKAEMEGMKDAVKEAAAYLYKPEQWNPKCKDFPRIAMRGIVCARQVLDSI